MSLSAANLARIGDINLDAVKMPKMGATPLGQNLRGEVPRGGKHQDKGGMIDVMA
jgi:hypothetical protein